MSSPEREGEALKGEEKRREESRALVVSVFTCAMWDDRHTQRDYEEAIEDAIPIVAKLLSAHEAGIWEAAAKEMVERCLAVVHREEDATNAAKEFATGKFLEEVLVARKVLRSVAEKIARRHPRSGSLDELVCQRVQELWRGVSLI